MWGFAVPCFRRFYQHFQNSLHHIVDIGEIALHIAMIIDMDRFALHNLLGKAPIGHIRPSPRSVNGEEPQACHWNIVEMRVTVGHQFIRLFRRCIERQRAVRRLAHRKGHLGIRAIDGAGTRVNDMLEIFELAAKLQNRQKGAGQAVSYPGLRRKMYDQADLRMITQRRIERGPV